MGLVQMRTLRSAQKIGVKLFATGTVLVNLRHAREFFLQRLLVVRARMAPRGFDFALTFLPGFAGLAVGYALALVGFHFTGRAAGNAGGIATQICGVERNAAWFGIAVFAEVAVVVPGVALEDRRRRQAFGRRGFRGGCRR